MVKYQKDYIKKVTYLYIYIYICIYVYIYTYLYIYIYIYINIYILKRHLLFLFNNISVYFDSFFIPTESIYLSIYQSLSLSLSLYIYIYIYIYIHNIYMYGNQITFLNLQHFKVKIFQLLTLSIHNLSVYKVRFKSHIRLNSYRARYKVAQGTNRTRFSFYNKVW